MAKLSIVFSHCRQCGGDRRHSVLREVDRHWDEAGGAVDGHDTWQILECRGCGTVSFAHTHWFSEDWELGDEGPEPIIHTDRYPPSPSRAAPEWSSHLLLGLAQDEMWLKQLHSDIYAALGSGAFSLAAMGMRAIIDHIVTSKAGDTGYFVDKLNRLRDQGLITDLQVAIIDAAFDAGSAAAHRGYSPTRDDAYSLLDIAESLMRQIYYEPMEQRRQAEAAASLRSRTPARTPRG